MNLKKLLLCTLIILIPLLLLFICNKRLIKDQCDYNLKCIKDELEINLKNFNKSYERKKYLSVNNNLIKNEVNEVNEDGEIVEGFFDGIKTWFSGSSPSSINIQQPPLSPTIPLSPVIHQNINESLDTLNKKNSTLISAKFPPDNNELTNSTLNNDLINTNSINDNMKELNNDKNDDKNKKIIDKININSNEIKSILDKKKSEIDNIKDDSNKKNTVNNIKDDSNKKKDKLDNNLSNLFGKCQFFNEKCPDDYSSFGNFSIDGVGSKMTLNCGNISDIKPANAIAQIKNNSVYEIHVIDKGHGYIPSKPPKITIEGGKGNGATAEAIVDDDGYLKLIKVINPGYNYSETPNVIIDSNMNDSSCHFCCKT